MSEPVEKPLSASNEYAIGRKVAGFRALHVHHSEGDVAR